MTSNLGTDELNTNSYGFGDESPGNNFNDVKDRILEKMKDSFRPEFINRLDESIVFNPLSKKDALKIIDLFLRDLVSNLSELGLKITITKKAKTLLVNNGFNQEYGARNLSREVQISLEDPISEMLLDNEILLGDTIKIDCHNGKIRINSQRKNKVL